MARLFAALLLERVEPSNLSRLPGHASPSQPVVSALVAPPVLPVPAVSCRVVSCLWPVSLSVSGSLLMVRSFGSLALRPTKPLRFPFPPFPLLSDSLPLSPQVKPRLTSAQQQQPPSPARPSHWKKPSPACSASSSASSASPAPRPSPSFEATFFAFSAVSTLLHHKWQKQGPSKVQGQGQLPQSPPQDLERDGHLSSRGIAAESRQLDLCACTCPSAPPSPKRRQSIPQRLYSYFFFLPSCTLCFALLASFASRPTDRHASAP